MNYTTTPEIEVAVANHFGARTHVIVPNVSWGMFNYELDLVVLNIRSMYASEIEIKISKSDLKRDQQKRHHHDSNMMKWLWFAIPHDLVRAWELIPDRAGILCVEEDGKVLVLRKPAINTTARKWDYRDAYKLARLGTLRIWDLRRNLNQSLRDFHGLRLDKHPRCKWEETGEDRFWVECMRKYVRIEKGEKRNHRFCHKCGGEIEYLRYGYTAKIETSDLEEFAR